MDRQREIQLKRRLEKQAEDKQVFDAIMALKNCEDYKLRKKYQQGLIATLCSKGYIVETLPEFPVNFDIKLLIRADLESFISKIDFSELSAAYRQTLEDKQNKKQTFLDKDYQKSLENSSSWKIVSEFTSFKKIFNNIKKKMLEKQINPAVVEEMNVIDCLHFVSKNCRSAFREYSVKKKFIQTFIAYNEEELRKIHHLQGVDVRYTQALIKAMKKDGISCGITVLDEKGEKISGPEYTIHHRIPVKHAGEVKYFSEVNLFKNLVLVERDLYHKLIHICESSEYLADKRYFSKLLTPKNSVLIAGLEPKDVIRYDFKNRTKIVNPILASVVLPVYQENAIKSDNKETKAKYPPKVCKIAYRRGGGRCG